MTPVELSKMTKLELLEHARSRGVRVESTMTKTEIIEAMGAEEKRKKLIAATVKNAMARNAEASKPRRGRPPKTARASKSVEAAKKAARSILSGRKTSKIGRPKGAATKVEAPKAPAAKAAPAKAAPKFEAPPAPKPEPKAAPKQAAKAPVGKTPARVPATRARGKAAPAEKAAKPKPPAEEFIRQMAEEGKYYLGAEQRIMPPVEAIDIPAGYGVDRIVALVRDPYWLFSYWEVTDHKYRELERTFGETWPRCRMILRVYDLTDRKSTHFDITLTPEARNWYVNVAAERRYQIAIGALSPDGRFEQVAISNVVETPSGRVSDRVDEEWMIPDELFDRIFAASGGLDMHAASGELRGLLERHLQEQITSGSGAISSFGSGAWPKGEKGRKFRLWVATELILYGGTEPDARVTVQGKEVKIRPDGTFSLRFGLPDGKLDLPVTAESADGVEERTIETDVTKKSRAKEPVIK